MKKNVIAVIVAFALSLGIVLLSIASIPENAEREMISNTVSVLPELSLTAVNAKIDSEYEYKVTDADAQLYISGIDNEFNALIVDFMDSMPAGTQYQLFYSRNDETLNEVNSVSNITDKDADHIVIDLPEKGHYDVLRLDIDTDYQLEDISIGTQEYVAPERSYLAEVLEKPSLFPFFQFTLCFAILLIELLLVIHNNRSMKKTFTGLIHGVKKRREFILVVLLKCIAGAAVGYLLLLALNLAGVSHSSSGYTAFIFCMIGAGIGLFMALWHQYGQHPEFGFLIIALCFGLLFAVLEPPINEMCWDDETHYARIIRLSYGDLPYITDAENRITKIGVLVATDAENKTKYTEEVNSLQYRGSGDWTNNTRSPINCVLAYLPAAGMIWLTRMLGCQVSVSVVAGRIANLLCYIILACCAIRQLRRGKMIVATVCLLPTIIFMAANYNYDPVCIVFVILGICIWMGVYQDQNAMMTKGKMLAMLLCLSLGILVKAVYFPMVLITAFLPESKFESKKAAKRYRILVILTMVLLAASFALPFLFGSNYSDQRGGKDVDALKQVSLILSDPLSYIRMMFMFLANDYFTVSNMMNPMLGCVRGLAYISIAGTEFSEMMSYLLLAMIFATWLGSSDIRDNGDRTLPIGIKTVAAVLAWGSMCIAVTSLYCGFTPVGSNTVAGFQQRYMLPVTIPLLLIMRPVCFKNTIRPEKFNRTVLSVVAVILLSGILPLIWNFI